MMAGSVECASVAARTAEDGCCSAVRECVLLLFSGVTVNRRCVQAGWLFGSVFRARRLTELIMLGPASALRPHRRCDNHRPSVSRRANSIIAASPPRTQIHLVSSTEPRIHQQAHARHPDRGAVTAAVPRVRGRVRSSASRPGGIAVLACLSLVPCAAPTPAAALHHHPHLRCCCCPPLPVHAAGWFLVVRGSGAAGQTLVPRQGARPQHACESLRLQPLT